jgi:hypothetical protein
VILKARLRINTTEPGGGSDLAAIKTEALWDGENYVMNGEKAYLRPASQWGAPRPLHPYIALTSHKGMTSFVPI